MLNQENLPRYYEPGLSVGHLCSVSMLHLTVSKVAHWHSNNGIHVMSCNISHRTAWVLRTEAGSCSQHCFPSHWAPGTESGGEHRARWNWRHRWGCTRGLLMTLLLFGHAPPNPQQGQPAKALQRAKWHEQTQVLKRSLHPQCIEEGLKRKAGSSDNSK